MHGLGFMVSTMHAKDQHRTTSDFRKLAFAMCGFNLRFHCANVLGPCNGS